MSAASCDDSLLSGPEWTPAAHQLGVRGFLALWSGERRVISELTTDLAMARALSAAGRLELDHAGVLVGVHGLVARATAHRIEHAGRTVHTWCALDAIGIPAALALDATAVTSCPCCGVELRVVLRTGHADAHADLRLWLPGGLCRHLVEDFCRHSSLYCNRQHLSSVVAVDQPGRAIDVTEAAAIGRVTWADVAMARQNLIGGAAMTTEATADQSSTSCWCCGESRPNGELFRFFCHPEVALCDTCVGWLGQQRQERGGHAVRQAIPILATSDVTRALRHYEALGFEAEEWEGGGYGFLHRDGVELHLGQSNHLDPTTNPVGAYLFVADADQLHAEWAAAAVDGQLEAPVGTDYGLREGRHVDPDGNVIRFGSAVAAAEAQSEWSEMLAGDDPLARGATAAVQAGDLEALERILREHPDLATARIGDRTMSRTLLHAATDWPGHYPAVAHVIDLLVRAGADVNARFHGPHAETPLHWAASSDDVEALDALLDAGADIEASGAVLGGGSPLADACGFGQWQAARRLVERGAMTRLKDAAALGLMERVEAAFAVEPIPTPDEITMALWSACHGGQRQAAEYLLDRGANVNWIGWDDLTPLDVATQAEATELVRWLRDNGAKSASELSS